MGDGVRDVVGVGEGAGERLRVDEGGGDVVGDGETDGEAIMKETVPSKPVRVSDTSDVNLMSMYRPPDNTVVGMVDPVRRASSVAVVEDPASGMEPIDER